MRLRPFARNLKFVLKHSVHQKLVLPFRRRQWARQTRPFVFAGARNSRFRLYPTQYVDSCVYTDGIYERRFLDFLRARLRPGGIMLDVGANIGTHAIYLSDLFDKVHCFEPCPLTADRLQENIDLNDLKHVHVHRIGLGSRDEWISFSDHENLNLRKFVRGDGSSCPAEKLPITTGDKWAAEIGLSQVDYIKIDVEGFEAETISGLQKTIGQFQPLVTFEYWGQSDQLGMIRSTLAGYEIYEPVIDPPPGNSMQKIGFYLAHATNPEMVRFTEPENRLYSYLIAIPPHLRSRFDVEA